VSKDGAVLGRFNSKVAPNDPQLIERIDEALSIDVQISKSKVIAQTACF